ncbi:Inner membrane protein RclC [Mycolicibacterium aubagnense]
MATALTHGKQSTIRAASAVSAVGGILLRLGLIVPLAWIGIAKFTNTEAAAIMPLITHEPLMSWLYEVLSVQTFSNALGCLELLAAVLIAIRPLSARVSAVGSGIATLLFISTISFLFTTPGVVASSSLHVPLLTDAGDFLIKDVALLGAAVWTLGEALMAHAAKGACRVGEDG